MQQSSQGHLLSLEFDTFGEEQPVSCSSGRAASRKGGGGGRAQDLGFSSLLSPARHRIYPVWTLNILKFGLKAARLMQQPLG